MSQGKTTIDPNTIRKWAEERGAHPATAKGTGSEHVGILRLDFDPRNAKLAPVSWDEFFEKFDDADLAFLHQDRTPDDSVSRVHKFASRASR